MSRLPKKLEEQQRKEYLQMLIPEMLPEKAKSLGINPPPKQNDLIWILNNRNTNFEFIDGVVERFPKIYKNGVSKSVAINGKEMQTEAGVAEEQLRLAEKQLRQLRDEHHIPSKLLSDVATTFFWAGYHAGAHDYKVNVEQYANDGFTAKVVTPKKGGTGKSNKTSSVKSLCQQIENELSTELPDVFYSKEILTAAIAKVIKDFSQLKNNSQLPCFEGFINRYPEYSTIKSWLSPRHTKETKTLKKITKEQLTKEIKRRFTTARINKLLN